MVLFLQNYSSTKLQLIPASRTFNKSYLDTPGSFYYEICEDLFFDEIDISN